MVLVPIDTLMRFGGFETLGEVKEFTRSFDSSRATDEDCKRLVFAQAVLGQVIENQESAL